MKAKMDKLISGLKINRKIFVFLVILGIIGLIVGSIFVVILNDTDKTLVKNYLDIFVSNINNGKLNYLLALKNISFSNYAYVIFIWLLGISVIGIPVIIFMYFMKCFMLGFSIASILVNYKLKGVLLTFVYIFPHHIIALIMYTILIMYSLTLSLKIGEAVIKKKNVNFRVIINKYLWILILTLIVITLTNLFEVYICPYLIKTILPIIKL